MRMVTFRDLPLGWETETVLLKHLSFGSSWDPHSLTPRRSEQAYPAYADYGGLCAIEQGKIASSLAVLRYPLRVRRGVVRCSGLGAVATQQRFSRRGFAQRLIQEAHRRERANGSAFMLHYANRSQVAHALYEKLGYCDVLEFPRAIRLVPTLRYDLPTGWVWRPSAGGDRSPIESLYSSIARLRYGFIREATDWWPGPEGWFVLEHQGKLVAFAKLEKQGRVLACEDAASRPGPSRALLLRCLESEASEEWLMLGTTLLRELRSVLARRKYSISRGSYSVLMARSLGESVRSPRIAHELGADDPDFLVGSMDSY